MTKKEITQDDLTVTIASYDQIAGEYYSRWHDRSLIENRVRRFIEMIKECSSLSVLLARRQPAN